MAIYPYPVAKALTRRHLMLGGEREPVMCSVLVTGLLIYTMVHFTLYYFIPIVVLLEMCAILVFRAMCKRDPFLVRVAIRRLSYRQFYPPRAIPAFNK